MANAPLSVLRGMWPGRAAEVSSSFSCMTTSPPVSTSSATHCGAARVAQPGRRGAEALAALRAEAVEKEVKEVDAQMTAEEIKEIEAQRKETLEEIITKQLAEQLDGKSAEEQWRALLEMTSYNLCGACHAALGAEEQRQFEALHVEPTP